MLYFVCAVYVFGRTLVVTTNQMMLLAYFQNWLLVLLQLMDFILFLEYVQCMQCVGVSEWDTRWNWKIPGQILSIKINPSEG
jgi:uncharacterized membrane protein